MIIGMARQLYDGMIDYDDGTPTSTPQMAYDVSNFISYMQRREGGKKADRMVRYYAAFSAIILLGAPLRHLIGKAYFKGMSSYRYEVYAIRDGVYYSHFRTG